VSLEQHHIGRRGL